MNSDNWKECERNVQLYKELNAKHIDVERGRNIGRFVWITFLSGQMLLILKKMYAKRSMEVLLTLSMNQEK